MPAGLLLYTRLGSPGNPPLRPLRGGRIVTSSEWLSSHRKGVERVPMPNVRRNMERLRELKQLKKTAPGTSAAVDRAIARVESQLSRSVNKMAKRNRRNRTIGGKLREPALGGR